MVSAGTDVCYNGTMYDLRFHVRYQSLIRQDLAPPLLCPCGAQLFIKVAGDVVDYECWSCDRTVVLGLATLKSMDAYVKENNERSGIQGN